MRCVSFCTAKSYDLRRLHQILDRDYLCRTYRDVLYCRITLGEEPCDAFFFDYGVAVFWGGQEDLWDALLHTLTVVEQNPLSEKGEDDFTFSYGQSPSVVNDGITLPDRQPLTKLAVSQGIAQSVKLSTFEDVIDRVIEETQYLPEELAARGRIRLRRSQIRKMMGRLFLNRAWVNLHTEILDTPEFFWEHSELEPIYRMVAKNLDLFPRVEVLNRRLDIIGDLLNILHEELKHQHSSTLEWIIIILIAIEILVEIGPLAA